MNLSEIQYSAGQAPVDGYGPGFFRVEGKVFEGGLFITSQGQTAWDGFADLAPLIAAADDYDVIFIGTGAEIAPLPAEVSTALTEADVPFDVMSSPSAARTYNVLLSEGRRIALAVLPV